MRAGTACISWLHSYVWSRDPIFAILISLMQEVTVPEVDFDDAGFRAAVKQFKETIRWFEGGRREFERFDTGVIGAEESYKPRIRETARVRLNLSALPAMAPGKGEVLDHVIHAIEVKGSNLLNWQGIHGPASRAHIRLIEIREQGGGELAEAERLLKALYLDTLPDAEVFEALRDIVGRNYPLMAYLLPERQRPLPAARSARVRQCPEDAELRSQTFRTMLMGKLHNDDGDHRFRPGAFGRRVPRNQSRFHRRPLVPLCDRRLAQTRRNSIPAADR